MKKQITYLFLLLIALGLNIQQIYAGELLNTANNLYNSGELKQSQIGRAHV